MGMRFVLWCPGPKKCGKCCVNVWEKARPLVYRCPRCKREYGAELMRSLNATIIDRYLSKARRFK